ncbi:MAG: DUF4167 domain-containing protein [Pelagibacteraceae bacterium TMED232]|nr:MAG: DUF4167 domain-containing protein [Pelagibacteraceae bacterium TMED232]|tara:strand:- start:1518 stop:1913 length:396 start_codon:yes stop_codon:yes gene_type:complete
MVTFRNNNGRRNNFRRSDRNFKTNGDRSKFTSNFSNSENFQRKIPGRNNHNAPKLIEKYNNLAREALSGGDKILSENYFQHADHFTRILKEQEDIKKSKFSQKNILDEKVASEDKAKIETIEGENVKTNQV